MAQLTDLSDIVNRVTGGNGGAPEHIFFYKDSRVSAAAAAPTVAGRMTSLWQYNGQPADGAIPAAAAVPTNVTAGSLLQTNPAGGTQKWLLGITAASSAPGTLIVQDRLLHNGGLNGTAVTAQTVGGTLTRNTGGLGNQIQIEIYTLIGTTATTVVVNYTNELGVSRTSPATPIGGTNLREVQRIIPIPLAAGDRGVRSVQSVQLALSTGTAGSFGVNIVRPIAIVPLGLLGSGNIRDFISGLPSIPEIASGACLYFTWLANGTAAPQVWGSMHFIEK